MIAPFKVSTNVRLKNESAETTVDLILPLDSTAVKQFAAIAGLKTKPLENNSPGASPQWGFLVD